MNKSSDGGDQGREDQANTPRNRERRLIDYQANEREIRNYFEARHNRLDIVATTVTEHGQTIDWIWPQSQVRGRELAEPPPVRSVKPLDTAARRFPEEAVLTALQTPSAERGPRGTVPIIRKNLDGLSYRYDLKRFLSKTHGHRVTDLHGLAYPAPEADGSHRYGSSSQDVTAFGAEGVLSCFDPYLEAEGDMSLIQVALSNSDLGFRQTVEAGWQEIKDIYGDWVPHLFVYYTTNGYTDDDDDEGGYNTDVDGWVQIDDAICPEITFVPYSERDGTQYRLSLKYQLFNDNWWLRCQDRWIGYYSARLFMGNQSVFSTLGDHADYVGFYGEIFDSDDVAGRTRSDMGSGRWPDTGWRSAAYIHNMRYQSDRGGKMTDYDGSSGIFESDPDMYGIEEHFNSGTNWGSYFYVGGPGA
jgi:hypothetical protein